MNQILMKELAAKKAVEFIKSNSIIGLGTGSTTDFALIEISKKIKGGLLKNIFGIPTSKQTELRANELGIPLTTFEENIRIDLTIDGADEVDENLQLIKGGGGALLREKIVAQASNKEIIIVDSTKVSKYLGEKWAVPIEVIPFAVNVEIQFLKSIGGNPILRKNKDSTFVTDEGNYILDTNFGIVQNPIQLSNKFNERAGIVEHGLFINLATTVIIADNDEVKILNK